MPAPAAVVATSDEQLRSGLRSPAAGTRIESAAGQKRLSHDQAAATDQQTSGLEIGLMNPTTLSGQCRVPMAAMGAVGCQCGRV